MERYGSAQSGKRLPLNLKGKGGLCSTIIIREAISSGFIIRLSQIVITDLVGRPEEKADWFRESHEEEGKQKRLVIFKKSNCVSDPIISKGTQVLVQLQVDSDNRECAASNSLGWD